MKYSIIVCVSHTHTLPTHISCAVKLHQSPIFAEFVQLSNMFCYHVVNVVQLVEYSIM
jgi:hypothetical protein